MEDKMKIEAAALSATLEEFIGRYAEELKREGAILGLSGGLDSAVVAALCQRALGPAKTLALVMPEKESKKEHVRDALEVADELGIEARVVDITPYLKKLGVYRLSPVDEFFLPRRVKGFLIKKAHHFYERKAGEPPFSAALLGSEGKPFNSYLKKINAYYRSKHRLRMVVLYFHAELENRLVVGAGNKSEYEIGFFVKHGCDAAADVMPLLNLYKTQVRDLARYLGIPAAIIDKAPSPDVIPGVTDELAIGVAYGELDLILLALEEGWGDAEITGALGVGERTVRHVRRMVQRSRHMREVYAP